MRGGPLSDADVVDALQPFILTFWAQKDRKDPPADIQALYDEWGGRSNSNVTCFILDSKGKLLRGFNGFPGGANKPGPSGFDEISRHFLDQIAQAGDFPARETKLRLPDVENGVRIFVRLPDPKIFGSYRSPVLEVVADDGEWKTLAKPTENRTIDAAALSRWLKLCYPPGVNEQLKPYSSVEGSLTLTPDGILSGDVSMTTPSKTKFKGTLRAVITYDGARPSIRGVVDGIYPREDRNRRTNEMKLVAAIESRPD